LKSGLSIVGIRIYTNEAKGRAILGIEFKLMELAIENYN